MTNPGSRDGAFVSVVMPIRNEAAFIAQGLAAVLSQNYPAERMEVIVADGMSTDGTREIVKSFQARHCNLRLIDNPGKFVPTGLNAAIRQAKGDIVIRVDGHCEVSPDYVSRCVQRLQREGVDAVGGPIETVGETYCARAIALAMGSKFGVGGAAFRTVKDRALFVDTVAFPAYKRQTIERAGPFDEELIRNQDDEYNYRIRKLGGSILLSPDVRSRYYSRSSLTSLWRQYFQYGYWKVRVMQKHPGQMQPRQFVPFVLVIALLMSLLMAPFSDLGVAGFWLVAASYISANLGASILTAGNGNWRLLPLLPMCFAVLHLAYGLGFLAGLARFSGGWANRKKPNRLKARMRDVGME